MPGTLVVSVMMSLLLWHQAAFAIVIFQSNTFAQPYLFQILWPQREQSPAKFLKERAYSDFDKKCKKSILDKHIWDKHI